MHGILGDERTWQPAYHFLSDNIQPISYSMIGFGEAGESIPAEQFNTSIHAEELIQFCRAFTSKNNKKITIVAWSYSCHVALLAALQAPELFEALYLYDCIVPNYGLENDEEKSREFSQDLNKMMTPVIKAIRSQDTNHIIETFTSACSNRTDYYSQNSLIQTIKKINSHTVSRLITQKEPTKISPKQLQTLSVPCGIYWGEFSRPIFKLASEALFQHLPDNIRIKNSGVIPKADHLLPEEAPNLFIQRILNN